MTASFTAIHYFYDSVIILQEHLKQSSSNMNEVIKAVLNPLFFYEKISHAQKAPKAPKVLKCTKTLRQKHKNANKRIRDYFPLRCFLGAFFIFVRL